MASTSIGWAAIYRSIQECWVWDDKPFSKGQAWIDLIITANHEDVIKTVKGRPHKFEKGTVSMSQRKLAARWGWSRDKVVHFLHDLESTGMIEKQSKDYTIIKLVNWDKFQVDRAKKQSTKQSSDQSSGQSSGQSLNNNDLTMNNNINKGESEPLPEIKAPKYPTGKYNNVMLTQGEAVKLSKEYPNEATEMIDHLSEYMNDTGKKYPDHYKIICKWIREDKEKPKQQPKKNQSLEFAQRTYTDEQIRALERKKLGLE